MDKKQQLFAKLRLAAYALVIAIFAITGVTLFISAQFRRAMYTDSKVHLADAQSNLETLKDQPDSYKKEKQVAWYSDLENYFTLETENNAKKYKAQSVVSYTCLMMALVSFGVSLKVEDYFKSKEEK